MINERNYKKAIILQKHRKKYINIYKRIIISQINSSPISLNSLLLSIDENMNLKEVLKWRKEVKYSLYYSKSIEVNHKALNDYLMKYYDFDKSGNDNLYKLYSELDIEPLTLINTDNKDDVIANMIFILNKCTLTIEGTN